MIEGKVSKIKIIRPAAHRIWTDPIVIEIQGIDLILGPANFKAEQNVEDEEETKKRRIEQLIKRLHMTGEEQGLWSSYSRAITIRLIENAQINVVNISVSYQDKDILGERSIGAHIKMLDASKVNTDDTSVITKRAELQDLSIYFNYNGVNEYILKL